jgi:endonuclease/exonuclease/phosphatase family metal-dependent hydrolase
MKLRELSIGSFNLYNLNEPGRAIYTDRDGWTQAQYDLKILWTAAQLRSLVADVIGFQELWHRASVQRAIDTARLTNDFELVTAPQADGSRITCGAMVRNGLRASEPEWITAFPAGFVLRSRGDDPQTPAIDVNIRGFSRPVLHFTIAPREDREPVHVFVCHFKSKGPTQVYNEPWYRDAVDTYRPHATGLGSAISTIRRTAEAAALRFMLSTLMKGSRAPVIVLGDINDGQHCNTANILTEQPQYLVGGAIGGSDTALYTTQTLQEYRDTRDVYYTHVHQDIRESLDHILVSQEFYDHSRQRVWMFDGLAINNDHLNFDNHKDDGTGDHGVIRAAFKYRPAAGA